MASSAVGNAPVVATNMNPELFKAARSGKIERLEAVFSEKLNISEQTTPIQDTAIHVAAGFGHLDIIKRIHERYPTLFTKTNAMGDTSLHKAARAGRYEELSFLIECSKTSRATDVENGFASILRKGNIYGDTIMHELVRRAEHEIVKQLIIDDPELVCIDNNVGESPLYVAVEKENMNIIKEILETERFSCKGPNGQTALHAAVIHERQDITKLLLDKNPDLVNDADDNNRNPLHFASGLGLVDYVCMLMECNSSKPCLLDKLGLAPVHNSAHFGEIDVLKLFLKLRPDLKDLLDRKRRNILHIAVGSQQVGVVKYILQTKKLNDLLNGKDEDNNTPLHQATITGNAWIVNLLVRHNSTDVMALNRNQQTALDIARSPMEEIKADDMQDKSLVLATLLYASSPPWSNHKPLQREIILLGKRGSRESIESCKKKGKTLLIVATLVSTLTYAAGFTPPGGYKSEGPIPNGPGDKEYKGLYQGEAILKDYTGFHIYLASATVSMLLSVGAILLLLWLQFTTRLEVARGLLRSGQILLVASIILMVLSYYMATFLTLCGLRNRIGSVGSDADLKEAYIFKPLFLAMIVVLGAFFRVHHLLGHRTSVYLQAWIHEYTGKRESGVSTLFDYRQGL